MSPIALLLVSLVAQPGGDTLGAVRFAGNRAFRSKTLLGVVTARPKKPSTSVGLERDVAALERFYQDNSFPDVQVERSLGSGRRPVVTFTIVEGPQLRVGAVVLSGNTRFGVDRLLPITGVSPGQPATRGSVEGGVLGLKQLYLNSGYPLVAVEGSLERVDTLAAVTFAIREGPRCRIGEVIIRGNRNVRTATILRASELRRGEFFSQLRLNRARTRLYATRLFSRVAYALIPPDTTPGAPDTAVISVRFDVAEQAYRSVAFGVGAEIPTNRLLLSGEWEHDNVLNRGQSLLVGADYAPALSGDYEVNTRLTYRVPYLLLTRIDFQTKPFFTYERIDSNGMRVYGIETGMSRSLVPQLTVGLSNRLKFVSDTAGVTNSLALTGQYDTRDDIFDPRRGLSVQAVAEVAGGLLRGANDFYRLSGDARVYQNIGGGFVLALRGMAGRVMAYSERAVPYNEAYTLGGRSSLRGYPDRSLGPDSGPTGRYGTTVVNGNAEVRTPYLFDWVGLVGFFDIGNVSRDFRLFAYEYSAGGGVRVRTPIGPVRVDWGKRLHNPESGDYGRFYLGLLHAF